MEILPAGSHRTSGSHPEYEASLGTNARRWSAQQRWERATTNSMRAPASRLKTAAGLEHSSAPGLLLPAKPPTTNTQQQTFNSAQKYYIKIGDVLSCGKKKKKMLSSTGWDRKGDRRANQDLMHIHSEDRLRFCRESKKQTNRLEHLPFFFLACTP